MTRAELIEAMARAICIDNGFDPMCRLSPRDRPRWMGYQENATAALAAIEAAGFAAVPREATWEMHGAGHDASLKSGGEMEGDWVEINERIYRAMIAASPVEARDE